MQKIFNSSLVAYTENASGGGSDKEHKKYFVDMELYKLKDYVTKDLCEVEEP